MRVTFPGWNPCNCLPPFEVPSLGFTERATSLPFLFPNPAAERVLAPGRGHPDFEGAFAVLWPNPLIFRLKGPNPEK